MSNAQNSGPVPAQSSHGPQSCTDDWRPAATWSRLRKRATHLAAIRAFFSERQVLEVETPALHPAAIPETHIEPMTCSHPADPAGAPMFLHTSPEAAMKRLLAAGSGPIYQICHVFRAGEQGQWHNPEFTMLEWYRPGWSWHALMDEVHALVATLTDCGPAYTLSYRQALMDYAGVDPFAENIGPVLRATLMQIPDATSGVEPVPAGLLGAQEEDLLDLFDWLWLSRVEPALVRMGQPEAGTARRRAVFITGFPVARAAMSMIDPGPPPTAQRFELYLDGIELANGYQELTDAAEQSRRLEQVNAQRIAQQRPPLPVDHRFLAALAAGMPACAGVALGVDRLIARACDCDSIHDVLTFPLA
jgi:lysyl-tRNA synthetase class 2